MIRLHILNSPKLPVSIILCIRELTDVVMFVNNCTEACISWLEIESNTTNGSETPMSACASTAGSGRSGWNQCSPGNTDVTDEDLRGWICCIWIREQGGLSTHYGMVTPYGNIDLGQHCLRVCLVWWHHANSCIRVEFPSVKFLGSQLRAISNTKYIRKKGFEITHSNLKPDLRGGNFTGWSRVWPGVTRL